ncbi:DUF4383 domain-containing protein [Kribbella sp. CA-293567]|uniref:DUF4383 domain-containing protein n=1 Tax=Kribbella sp. CA-293567 TaxID=3002436 RepID=UPI0022DD2CE9|nr:DUF4383 domain-containing protein [Kribbella sp. CA-293567]WBQ03397.1 DUF4383 domain-containing protein [Kribbella sp. CA-293567]
MPDNSRDNDSVTLVQHLARWISGALIALGLFGFVPGLTTHVSGLSWAGRGSTASLFDLIQVSVLHNVVHLAVGAGALATARRPPAARRLLAAGGLLYSGLAVYGWALNRGWASWNFLPFNEAGSWLHLLLALVLVMSAAGAPGLSYTELRDHRRGTGS